jgi:hypothetical protein
MRKRYLPKLTCFKLKQKIKRKAPKPKGHKATEEKKLFLKVIFNTFQ